MSNHRPALSKMTPEQVRRFVGGRNARAARRRCLAELRRVQVARRLKSVNVGVRGWKAELARELGIHRETLANDLREIAKAANEARQAKAKERRALASEYARKLEASLHPDPIYQASKQRDGS